MNLIALIKERIKPKISIISDVLFSFLFYLRQQKNFNKVSENPFSNFDFYIFKTKVISFLDSLNSDPYNFKFSTENSNPSLYSSAYALMSLSLLGEAKSLSLENKVKWTNYFNSFQNKNDGLFYDRVINNDIFADSDWWGARHLAVHMISAYTILGSKPVYNFYFLEEFHDFRNISSWLDGYDWASARIGDQDLDNKIMNIGCLLQYQRDFFSDEKAANSLQFLKEFLKMKINPSSGMWGGFDENNPRERSRMIQFAYHLFQIYFYDEDFDFDFERIVKICLKTKNYFGGFGVLANSSACEDMDSIDLLCRFRQFVSPELKLKIDNALIFSWNWVLCNQTHSGGFVFRLKFPFEYGCSEMTDLKNNGNMLATWFRILSLAYIEKSLGKKEYFTLIKCPGYEF